MADIATLGLRLDANGFVSEASRATRSLDQLGAGSERVGKKVQQFATAGAFALGSLASSGVTSITSVLRAASGLGFAFGPIAGSVTLAISSIGLAMFESRKKVEEESEKMIDSFLSMEQQFSDSAKRVRIGVLELRRDALLEGIRTRDMRTTGKPGDIGTFLFDPKPGMNNRAAAEVAELTRRIGELRNLLGKSNRDSLSNAAKEAQEALGGLFENRFVDPYGGIASSVDMARDLAKHFAAIDDEAQTLANTIQNNLNAGLDDAFGQRRQDELEGIIKNLQKWLETLDDLSAKQQVMAGVGFNVAMNTLGAIGGPVGSIGQGALQGFAFGGPVGAAIGGINAFVDGLFGLGAAARQQREQMRQLKKAYDEFTETIAVQVGLLDPVQAQINQIQREFEDARNNLRARLAGGLHFPSLFPDQARELAQEMARLNELERLRHAQLSQTAAFEQEMFTKELEMRRARALGQDEDAERIQDAINRERELADARARGATEAEIAAVKEVQMIEAISKAIGQTQGRIDSLTVTISGLQGFRNALLLSPDAGLSKTAQLEEARRQYAEILGVSRGDDVKKAQEAAGRLPQAAQALLEFSRMVNASGAGFQSDFLQVLQDTQSLITRFGDLKSIEELQLEELRRIRSELTRGIDEGVIRPPNPLELPPGSGVLSELQASVAVSQAGFTQMVARLDTLNAKVEDLETAVRHQGEALLLTR